MGQQRFAGDRGGLSGSRIDEVGSVTCSAVSRADIVHRQLKSTPQASASGIDREGGEYREGDQHQRPVDPNFSNGAVDIVAKRAHAKNADDGRLPQDDLPAVEGVGQEVTVESRHVFVAVEVEAAR